MRTRKVIAALMAALALSGVAATVQPQSASSVVEARAKRSRHSRRWSKKSKNRTSRKQNNRKRKNKKTKKSKNWWNNLPKIKFNTHASLETQMKRALQLKGRKRDAAEYILMKEEGGYIENGRPILSRAEYIEHMKSFIQDVEHMRAERREISQAM